MSLFLRAAFAVIVLPGVMGFLLPLVVIEPVWERAIAVPQGLAVVVAGTALLLLCVREFYVAGKGTLAPWSPPKHLVVSGPVSLVAQSHLRRDARRAYRLDGDLLVTAAGRLHRRHVCGVSHQDDTRRRATPGA
jgi:hypothetical protein